MNIYHYTTYQNYKSIMNDGFIKTSYKEKKWKIKPAGVWLSLNPVCEYTCLRTVLDITNGFKRPMTMNEQSQKLGLVRFTLPFDKSNLCSWAAYKYKSNITDSELSMLETNGILAGSNPKNWFISFQDIPTRKIENISIYLNEEYVPLTDDLILPQFEKLAPIYSTRDGNYDKKDIQKLIDFQNQLETI